MIDTDKYEGHTEDIERWQMMARSLPDWANEKDEQLVRDAVYLLEEVKRLREEVKVLSKYRDIVTEFDDALLADGDTDIRWSAIYDERVFE